MTVCTGTSAMLHAPFDLGNVVAIYLLGVVMVAAMYGRGPAVLGSVMGALAVDFLFVPPKFGFLPEHAAHLLTFVVMVVVALTVGTMASRLREQLGQAHERAQRTATLYELARDLACAGDSTAVADAIDRHVRDRCACRAVLVTRVADSGLLRALGPCADQLGTDQLAAAGAVLDAPAGAKPQSPTPDPWLPMVTGNGTVGALGLLPPPGATVPLPTHRSYLETFANQGAIALERTLLADAAQRSAVAIEQERLRSTLLSSVSHDLRTPIATIIGASSALLGETPLGHTTRRELLESIRHQGERLERQVRNLLYMTRLEAGTVQAQVDWTPIDDVVGAALTRLEDGLRGREVITHVPTGLPPAPMDGLLMEQVLLNLLENVLRHTPSGTPVEVAADSDGERVRITVSDRGPGLPAAARERLFDKFYTTAVSGGSGLGLAICRAITSLHGGSITGENRVGGGAVFTVCLPLSPPASLPPLDLPHGRGRT